MFGVSLHAKSIYSLDHVFTIIEHVYTWSSVASHSDILCLLTGSLSSFYVSCKALVIFWATQNTQKWAEILQELLPSSSLLLSAPSPKAGELPKCHSLEWPCGTVRVWCSLNTAFSTQTFPEQRHPECQSTPTLPWSQPGSCYTVSPCAWSTVTATWNPAPQRPKHNHHMTQPLHSLISYPVTLTAAALTAAALTAATLTAALLTTAERWEWPDCLHQVNRFTIHDMSM